MAAIYYLLGFLSAAALAAIAELLLSKRRAKPHSSDEWDDFLHY